MGGGLVSRQMMHAPASEAIFQFPPLDRRRPTKVWSVSLQKMAAQKWPWQPDANSNMVGKQLCWSRRGPRVALERSLRRLSTRYDADVDR
jgi:hypothetical protein